MYTYIKFFNEKFRKNHGRISDLKIEENHGYSLSRGALTPASAEARSLDSRNGAQSPEQTLSVMS